MRSNWGWQRAGPPASPFGILIAAWYPFLAFTALTFAFPVAFSCLTYPK